MNLLNLLLTPRVTLAYLGQTVTISVTEEEEETTTADVTDHPVETGYLISDHAHRKPEEGEISGVLTSDLAVAGISLLGDPETKFQTLKAWQQAGALVVLTLYDRTYRDVALLSLRRSREGDGIRVSISWRRIVLALAAVSEAKLPPAARSAGARGQAAAKTANTSTPPPAVVQKSILKGTGIF